MASCFYILEVFLGQGTLELNFTVPCLEKKNGAKLLQANETAKATPH